MNFIVPSCTYRDLELIGMETNCFDVLIRYLLFKAECFIIHSLHLQVASINQDPIIDVEVLCFSNMTGCLYVVNAFEDIMDGVMHSNHFLKTYFCGRRGEFADIIEMHSM